LKPSPIQASILGVGATYDDEHPRESSIKLLGYSVGEITRHYAHRSLSALKATMTLPQPTALSALIKRYRECPCAEGRFADA
jgi:hypothetical protein